jgi:hypothetical protein
MRMKALCGLSNMCADAHLEVLYGLECSPARSVASNGRQSAAEGENYQFLKLIAIVDSTMY